MSEAKKKVYIYTDGGCSGNPGAGAYASILTFTDHTGKLHEKILTDGFKTTTNNRMEILAAVVGLEALKFPSDVVLTSDSKYLIDAIEKKWIDGWQKRNWKTADKSPVKNVDLWKRLLDAMKPHNVKFEWVKGHNGHDYNEKCDEIVKNTFKRDDLGIDENYINSLDANIQKNKKVGANDEQRFLFKE